MKYIYPKCVFCETKLEHPKVNKDKKYVMITDGIEKRKELKQEFKKNLNNRMRKNIKIKNKEKCGHKLWYRVINPPINIMTIIRRTLMEQDLGVFKNKKLKINQSTYLL